MKVKTIELNDILKYDQPTKFIVSSDDYDDSFTTPVLTAGKTFILGYTDEKEGVFNNLPAIIFDDFTTSFHYVDFPFKVKSSAMKILTPRSSDVSIKFIYYIMQGLKIDTELHKRYWISIFSKLKIQLPPLKTQEHIASILDDAAALRDKTAQLLEEYDLLAQSIFLDMFGAFKANSNFETGSLRKNCERIGKINKDYLEQNIEYVDISSINNQENIITSTTSYELNDRPSRAQQVLKKKDIVYSTVRPNLKNIAMVNSDGLIGSTGFTVFRTKKSLNPAYLFYLLMSENFTHYIMSLVSGANYPAIRQSTLLDIEIPIPPISLQNEFAEKIALIEQQKELVRQELKESEDLFNCLLQKAFKGELVPESQEA